MKNKAVEHKQNKSPKKSPKKSLGQNFLNSKSVLSKILDAGEVGKEMGKRDLVLEIGPGRGILTEGLLNRGTVVVAVEKDDTLFADLKLRFESEIKAGKLRLIHGDILDFEVSKLLEAAGHKDNPSTDYKLIANIPYNITGMIFRKFLEEDIQPAAAVLLVQKEVARKAVARDGKESVLSMSLKAYGNVRYVDTVSRSNFTPKPGVDSAILKISGISRKFFAASGVDEKKFFRILKAGFAHKRKFLMGNLKNDIPNIESAFLRLKIDKKIRAEKLSLEKWGELARII